MNSQWGRQHVRERVMANNPDCVFLEFTINDVVTITCDQSQATLNSIIDTVLLANPSCEIVLMTMNPRAGDDNFQEIQSSYYEVYRETARKRNCLLVDNYLQWIKLRETDRALYEAYIPDGCHPSAKGCEEVVTPNILRTLGVPF